jgi:3-deoxy-D-arabino-heptulosonate 7-phosphate (DAHP) synthase
LSYPRESVQIRGHYLSMNTSFQVGDVHIGSGELFLIAGPCVIESEEHAMRMAEIIKGVNSQLSRARNKGGSADSEEN